MDCEYWKDIVQRLVDINECRWASHVLATGFSCPDTLKESRLGLSELTDTNLGMALKCVTQEEIIEKTIYAYRDWSAQPFCDLILAQFDADKVETIFSQVKDPTPEMKLGVEAFLEDIREGH